MSQKRVLLVEDQDPQRNALHKTLERRGFLVASAADASTARRLVEHQKEPFDVVVLDMNLEDPEGLTGADLGIEFRRRKEWKDQPTEFLICSAYDNREYYKVALDLGAAAYLEKKEDIDLHSVTRHVRILSLRHALNPERAEIIATINEIAERSEDKAEAIRRFCGEVLSVELTASLGASFLLLWTDPTGTYGYSNQSDLPLGRNETYEAIQILLQMTANLGDVWVFDPALLQDSPSSEKTAVVSRLRNTVFIPLLAEREFRLSLGILPGSTTGLSQADDARSLAALLAEFLRPTVLRSITLLTTRWIELYTYRLAVLRATSQLCLYVGQEQLSLLDEARETGEVAEVGSSLKDLQLLAEDLRESGEILGELAQQEMTVTRVRETTISATPKSLISMGTIVQSAWSKTSRMLDSDAQDVFKLDGDCQVQGHREYLEIATSRVLQWFIQRLRLETPTGPGPSILVTCRESAEGPKVFFEDRSRKLPERLRRHLFVPFSQAVYLPPNKTDLRGPGLHLPLYMAKALVELGNGGLLEDRTETAGEFGHKLVMRFPPPLTREARDAAN